MAVLELKIYPLLVLLCCAFINGVLAYYFPATHFTTVLYFMWPGLLLCGLGLPLVGAWQFKQAQTTMQPNDPSQTTELVTFGIYRFTRNPMYLGFALILLAQSCFLTNLYTLIGTVIFVVYIHRFQIIPEQRMLLNHFGQVYSDYMQRVRPWI
ncbi:methyltransferase family protein [Pseudoalteromonas tunicata]|jgi:protein-S-isoprenylcysteine O-methyltransferase Ste14|uniref:Isoprenylcysteine carboxylmethyltransferase family protein n=1 Tax=Pseudoalteromonas tunicata D2 TaxID=87626 RepID=A4C4N5_9GAMM|nr:isoprenylcysteine carboxylmethyltransferase family protein [Pseudoalteromonas tunicata]ATC97004.1 hypothetical protein PTUN_b0657 [Pseudoalteromonas tunicata]AXT33124.1 isoprenylcysteine carboxylmethyltransferase family protein [Pseudoalteromonas tunicata]EAR30517.1 Predicted protein-S-isoprenylcysteine methyltransferase [Pseudoalteromonas tunicata D2]